MNPESPVLRLSAAQKMELVQQGYNPLNPDDVQRYLRKQPAQGDWLHLIGGERVLRKSLGESKIVDQNDYNLIEKNSPNAALNYADPNEMRKSSEVSSYHGRDIAQQVRTRSSIQETFQSSNQPQLPNISLPRSKKQAADLGYEAGVKYINAFIRLIKDPHSKKRKELMQALYLIQKTESAIDSRLLGFYRGGLNKAEAELYQKLK